jgi:polysaccharide biosynthesis protein PslG
MDALDRRRIARCAVASALVAFAAAPAARAAGPADFAGMHVSSTDLYQGDDRRAGAFAHQAASGVRTARVWFDWRRIELEPGEYRFAKYDPVVEDAARNGMRVLPALVAPPDFHMDEPSDGSARGWYPPRDPATMGRFAAVLVNRYGPRGSFWAERPHLPRFTIRSWQIWNEPNIYPWWAPGPDPAGYVRLLREVRSHVRRADPEAEIVAAGTPNSVLGPRAPDYLEDVYKAGGKGAWDSMALHPYGRTADDVLGQVDELRDVMASHGDASPIWVTEFGWASGGPRDNLNVGLDGQASALRSTLNAFSAQRQSLGIRGFTYYHWGDGPVPEGERDSVWFHVGLLEWSGAAKPALGAYRDRVAAMALPPLVEDPPVGDSAPGSGPPRTSGSARREDPASLGPELTGIRLKPARFRAARRGPPFRPAARCATRRTACGRGGANLSFSSSADATVVLRFARLAGGGAKSVPGRARMRVSAGLTKLRLLGRLKGRRLRPGGYRLILQATDAEGRQSAPSSRPLRIKKG